MKTYFAGVMKTFNRYRAMEEACRRHAELDKTTAARWLEEAELLSKLVEVEHRLQSVQKVMRPPAQRQRRTHNSALKFKSDDRGQ
jgi:hypothetical protein